MVEKNQRHWDGSVGKLDWKRCDFRCRRNVARVSEERTLAGRLFQMAGAAVQKPRVIVWLIGITCRDLRQLHRERVADISCRFLRPPQWQRPWWRPAVRTVADCRWTNRHSCQRTGRTFSFIHSFIYFICSNKIHTINKSWMQGKGWTVKSKWH